MNLADRMILNLDIYFGEDCSYSEENKYLTIFNRGECLRLLINDDENVTISQLNKCKYKGVENLEKIENMCLHLDVEYLYLEDQSNIEFQGYNINLGLLSILSKGDSWYNSLGYKQTNYKKEKLKWNSLRKNSIRDLYGDILKISLIQYKNSNKGYFTDGLTIYANIFDEELDDFNFREFIKNAVLFLEEFIDIDDKIEKVALEFTILLKSGKYMDDNLLICYLIFLSLFECIVNYTRCPLTKKLK